MLFFLVWRLILVSFLVLKFRCLSVFSELLSCLMVCVLISEELMCGLCSV